MPISMFTALAQSVLQVAGMCKWPATKSCIAQFHMEDHPEHFLLPMQVGIRPSGGLRLWDIKFGGQRIVYELALQEAMMSGGGTTPSQVPRSGLLTQNGMYASENICSGLESLENVFIALHLDMNFMQERGGLCSMRLYSSPSP